MSGSINLISNAYYYTYLGITSVIYRKFRYVAGYKIPTIENLGATLVSARLVEWILVFVMSVTRTRNIMQAVCFEFERAVYVISRPMCLRTLLRISRHEIWLTLILRVISNMNLPLRYARIS